MTAYTPEDFARCFSLRGYGKRKDALKWCEENSVDAPTEEDFERCYHDLSKPVVRRHGGPYVAMYGDGQNPVSAGNAPNSSGLSFAAQMAIEQREADRQDERLRRRFAE
jgi:hypothetical protein